jgi:hypothetical protein
MVTMDTLYSPHKTLPSQVLHLWHPNIIPEGSDNNKGKLRMWNNQVAPSANDTLSGRYYWSQYNPKKMRGLVSEWKNKEQIKSSKTINENISNTSQ